jgi:hypothetical protein
MVPKILFDYPQLRGIVVAYFGVKVWSIKPREQYGKAKYSLKVECHKFSFYEVDKLKKNKDWFDASKLNAIKQ